MDFRIITDLPPQDGISIGLCTNILLLGSCFAEHIGNRLVRTLPDGNVCVNPFGLLYNPLSINRNLSMLIGENSPVAEDAMFLGKDGLWHSWLFAGEYSAATYDDCRNTVVAALKHTKSILEKTDLLCLTWGTAHAFFLKERPDFVVANCHKEPQAAFVERRLTVDEVVASTAETINGLRRLRPDLKVILTISPYRYTKLGLHRSTLSKAVLHLAAERVTTMLPGIVYFPAYEIIIDELRDYRFYAEDMLHPTAQAADYVWERFMAWGFMTELKDFAADKTRLIKAASHHMLHPGSAAAVRFHESLASQWAAFRDKWGEAAGTAVPPEGLVKR